MAEKLKARGTAVMLEHGGLPEVLPPYLIDLIETTGGPDGPIGLQFVARPDLETEGYEDASDPLLEEEHEVAPGLIYKYQGGEDEYGKYPGRVLFTITRNCAAYCRYCTRGREVGIPGNLEGPLSGALSHTAHLSKEQVDQSLDFIRNNPEINEVILSGGDPLTIRPEVLRYVLGSLAELQKSGQLGVVRLGTRVPIHNPRMLKDHHFEALSLLKSPRLMVHINHPAELTKESLRALHRFRVQSNAVIMSQSVLLQGVNDNPQTLRELFIAIANEGFTPYYLYQNDEVSWAKHFTVPLDRAFDIWQHVRNRLSGVAAHARFVIDTPDGYGKIPLPEGGAWSVDIDQGYRDFQGKHHPIR